MVIALHTWFSHGDCRLFAIAAPRFSDVRVSAQNWDASPRAMWSSDPEGGAEHFVKKTAQCEHEDGRFQRTQLCQNT